MESKLALIPLLPLAGFAINGLVGKRLGKPLAALVALLGPAIAFVLSLEILVYLLQAGDATIQVRLWTWMATRDFSVEFAFAADRLTAVMLLVVTGVGSLIHLYSAEYMEGERRGSYARYFSYLNLFTAMMLVLVLGASLPLVFIGWEGVGLCSYLLIGYWYTNAEYASAGRKAFVVNRVGDFGFLLGMFVLLLAQAPAEGARSLELAHLNALAQVGGIEVGTLTTAAVLLFLGACGKSAQIPLHVWLPDAMAGPTPVSALIHAATMVTAGVYLVARLSGLFGAAPAALAVVAVVGVLTAFCAAVMAMTERDLKKVLAYSTISQLGYMFVGVATGVFAAGIFHLVTHAFFKALLFLGAGAVMHAMHTMDMRRLGGLRTKMPWTFWLFLIGAAALAGLPPTSGFFSKDEILAAALLGYHAGAGPLWLGVWVLGVLTALLTAFYIFRAVALTFLGEPLEPTDAHLHAHDPGWRMLVPLVVLGALAAAGGLLNVPHALGGHARFTEFLEPVLARQGGGVPLGHVAWLEWAGMGLTTLGGLLSAAAALLLYTRAPELLARLAAAALVRPWRAASEAKFWFDTAYQRYVVEPTRAGALALWEWVDVAVIDNAVGGLAQAARDLGRSLRSLQDGLLSRYTTYLAGGAVVVLMLVLGFI
ncbi:MAG: NADH-quinone oxidoreductase subunit L [Planctomycetota bacterium]|nr:MAG: NADH-quinone oxidoreductase subunit L [Planctomycetota bacterium]